MSVLRPHPEEALSAVSKDGPISVTILRDAVLRTAPQDEAVERKARVQVRRFHLCAVALARLAFVACAGTAALAQEPYPTRPVEIIVPFAAGGGTDLIARILCDGLSQRLGQSFVAVNRPGANTNV